MGIRKWFSAAGIALASMTGCIVNAAPVRDFYREQAECVKRGENPPAEEFSVRPEYQLGAKAAHIKTKLPESVRTTCGTTTKSPDGFDVRPTAGAKVSAGSWLRFYAGGEVEWSLTSELKTRHRPYEEEDHVMMSLDQSPVVFTEVTQLYTLKPVLGIEARIGSFKFGMDGRIPYSLVKVESGYLQDSGTEALQSDSWQGWGVGASASALYGGPSGLRGGLFFEAEKFEPDFGHGGKESKIENILGFLQLEYRF